MMTCGGNSMLLCHSLYLNSFMYIYMSMDANGVMHMLATIGGVKANLRSTVVCRVNNVNLTNGEL